MSGLRLIVGLGNPGPEYARTRHNAGFWFVDALAQSLGATFRHEPKLHGEACKVEIGGESVRLLKPATFMNESGRSVQAALAYYRIPGEACLVAHDDLDLPTGTARLKFDGGHGGQNGLRDIIRLVGNGKFYRMRMGIGRPARKEQVVSWVLGKPNAADEDALANAMARGLDALPLAVAGHFDAAMKQVNTKTA